MATMVPVGEDRALKTLKEMGTEILVVPREVFLAFRHFLSEEKLSGTITVHFKTGGICGVEALTKQTYK